MTAILRRVAALAIAALAACAPVARDAVMPSYAGAASANAPSGFVYVLLSAGGVSSYREGSTAPYRGILVPGLASAIGCDGFGHLWIANVDLNYVESYSAGGAKPLRTIAGTGGPVALAFDPDDVYVANRGAGTVTIYRPGTKSPFVTIAKGVDDPLRIKLGSTRNIFVLNAGGAGSVSEYGPLEDRPIAIVHRGIEHPFDIAVDPKGTLYVASAGPKGSRGWISVYAAAATRPSQTIRSGIAAPEAIAFDDAAGELYVANATQGPNAKGWISVYPLGASTPSRTIQTGSDLPTWLSFDGAGNLYVANVSNVNYGSVTVYAPGAGTPLRRITRGADGPLAAIPCSAT